MTERDIRTAFENLKEDVMSNVQTEERLEEITRPDRPRRRLHPAFAAMAGAAAVAVAIGAVALALRTTTPDPVPPANTSTQVPTTTVVDTTAPPTTVVDTTVAPTSPPVALPEIGAGTVMIANPEATGAAALDDGSVVIDAAVVVGDGAGGVIVQRGDEIVRIDPSGETEPLAGAGDLPDELGPVTIRLEDLAIVNGSAQVMFIVAGGVEEQAFEEIWLHDLASGSRTPVYHTGAYEGGIRRASLQNDVLVVTRVAEGFS
ncbi:MAG: hypothetical protein OEO77_13260, partial [Acidimicrobiia bacterium]|nr:hypothetical protein [Acidimicrobiia bacterium]